MVTGECDDNAIYIHLFRMYLSSSDEFQNELDLSSMSRMELYRMAKEKGLSVNKKITKTALCDLLIQTHQDHYKK